MASHFGLDVASLRCEPPAQIINMLSAGWDSNRRPSRSTQAGAIVPNSSGERRLIDGLISAQDEPLTRLEALRAMLATVLKVNGAVALLLAGNAWRRRRKSRSSDRETASI